LLNRWLMILADISPPLIFMKLLIFADFIDITGFRFRAIISIFIDAIDISPLMAFVLILLRLTATAADFRFAAAVASATLSPSLTPFSHAFHYFIFDIFARFFIRHYAIEVDTSFRLTLLAFEFHFDCSPAISSMIPFSLSLRHAAFIDR
jgi:hypothetical protein